MSLAGRGATRSARGTAASPCPERASTPGFLRGRRYGAIARAPEYSSLVETVEKKARDNASAAPDLAVYRLQNTRSAVVC